MYPDWKASLTLAFEALGPERVARGLAARGHDWNDCFLAMALYGEPGVLARQIDHRWRKEQVVSTLVGIAPHVVTEVVTAWDHEVEAFRSLALEWLEANRVTVPQPVGVGGG